MIVTEEEAKTKRCQESYPAAEGLSHGGWSESVPLPRDTISYSGGGSRARNTAPMMCIGSACMAWRWEDGTSDDEQLIAGKCYEYSEQEDCPAGKGWEICTDPEEMTEGSVVWRRIKIPRGYCGKAGRISRYS